MRQVIIARISVFQCTHINICTS